MAAAQTLFVGNLSFFSTEQDVQALFSRFGPLLSVSNPTLICRDFVFHVFSCLIWSGLLF